MLTNQRLMSEPGERKSDHPPSEAPATGLRDKLMDVAERISANQGPDAVTLDGIAQRAAVSLAEVKEEFPAREDLLQAVFHRGTIRLRELAFSLLAQTQGNGENRARNNLVKMFDLISAPDRAPLFGALIAARRDPFPDAMGRSLRQIGQLFHSQRREFFGKARSLKDTLYLVELTTIAMYGELALGDSARERLGLPVTTHERREFRRWFADKILELGSGGKQGDSK